MRFFERKADRSRQQPASTPTPKCTLLVALAKLKRKTADFIGKQSERLSTRQKWIAFVMLCCIAGSVCGAMIVRAVQGNSKMSSIRPVNINVPPIIHPESQAVPMVTDEQYKRLIKFKRSCDSLQRSEQGKIQYKDMVRSRPGLMDTVDFLISIKEASSHNIITQ